MKRVEKKNINETTRKMSEGWQIGSDKPMLAANYLDVNFSNNKLPMIPPDVCMIACRNPTKCGVLSSLMASASREIS